MRIVLILFLFAKAALCSTNFLDQESIVPDTKLLNKRVEKILSGLTLEQKIGQMLMYGFKGKSVEEDVARLIKKYHVGGLVVFTRNINNEQQLVTLNKDIQYYSKQATKIPAFIAIDQEGGKVLRIKSFATVLPGNMNIGATGSSALSFLAGKLTAVDLEMLGINMNFAPVLDVNMSKSNEVIGVRSFGDDPDRVSVLGSAYIKGVQSRKVSATAKHFPGHGNTSGDSHFETLVLNRSQEDLKKIDLKPFVSAISDDVDSVMTAHIAVPSLDPSMKPATLSKKIITGLLRKELGYNGLVISDDMEMRAITKDMSIGRAAVEAVLAGCDLITIVWTDYAKQDVYNSLLKAAKEKIISEERINESVRRVLRVKIKRRLFDENVDPKLGEIKQVVGNKFHQQISQLIAQKSITLVRNLKNVVPVNKSGHFMVLSPFSYLSDELNNFGLNNTLIKMDVKLKRMQIEQIVSEALLNEDKVTAYLVAVVDQSQAEVAKELKKHTKKPVIVAALDSPYVYDTVISADAYLCSYSFRTQALRALAKVITGDAIAIGKLPVVLDDNIKLQSNLN